MKTAARWLSLAAVCWTVLTLSVAQTAQALPRSVWESAAAGRQYDFEGRAFERDIAATLEDRINLLAWQAGVPTGGVHYAQFVTMVTKFGLMAAEVAAVRATSSHEDIGDLPGGGKPKTDVIAFVTATNGSVRMITISCKRVTGRAVTGHQYRADTYADVLDRDNRELREALNVFQRKGSWDIPTEAKETIAREIAPHLEALCRWVVGGYGQPCEERQLAQYLVAYRPSDNRFGVHSVEEYVRMLMALPKRKEGGTPFSWTYQGKRGTNIQLKLPVLFD